MSEDTCLQDICELKESLVNFVKTEFSGGLENVDTHEAGEVVDMIKDLYEAEKDAAKACYYRTVIEAIDKGDTRIGKSSDDVIESVRAMWAQTDPLIRKQMKSDLTKLLNEMTI